MTHARDILTAALFTLMALFAAAGITWAAAHRIRQALRHRAYQGTRRRAPAATITCTCPRRGPWRTARTAPCDVHGSAQAASAHLQKTGSR